MNLHVENLPFNSSFMKLVLLWETFIFIIYKIRRKYIWWLLQVVKEINLLGLYFSSYIPNIQNLENENLKNSVELLQEGFIGILPIFFFTCSWFHVLFQSFKWCRGHFQNIPKDSFKDFNELWLNFRKWIPLN